MTVPNYGMPGVAVSHRQAMRIGAAVLVVIVLLGIGGRMYSHGRTASGLRIVLHTNRIGDGVVTGTEVRADGVPVGKVEAITPDALGTQRITLRLDESRLDGLDDSLHVDYATANLFGISEVELRPGSGGAPLRGDSVIDLTGGRDPDVYDATMGSLLRSLARMNDGVLTPQLVSVIDQLGSQVKAFTPLLQAMVVLARTVADHQTMPLSTVLRGFGSALGGGADFIGATLRVIAQIYGIPVLREDRARFDATIGMVVEQLFPALQHTLNHAGNEFSGYAGLLTPILSSAARMVPTPDQSSTELSQLLDRLRTAMPDTPDGPVLNVDVDLRGVPVLAPLLGGPGGNR